MSSGPRPASSRTARLILWGSSLPALLAASFLYFPYSTTGRGPVLCPMMLLLGMPCPGCGITRAFGCATHGLLADAFQYHALWPLVLAYFVFLWVYQMIEVARGEPPKLPTYKIGGGALLLLLGFWALRLVWFFAHGGLAHMADNNALARLHRLLH